MVSFVLKINTSLVFFISIIDGFDYTMDYMENVARSFTKKYPSYLIHKKSEDKIKAFLTDRMKAKVENFVNAEAKNVTVTEVREIDGAPVPLWKPSGGRPLAGKHRCGACHERGHRRIRHPPRQCSQARRRIGEAQDNKAECYPCNSGVGSADGNQAIPAIPATSSGPVQPA